MPAKKNPAKKRSGPRSGSVVASVNKALQKHKELGLELTKIKKNLTYGDDPHAPPGSHNIR